MIRSRAAPVEPSGWPGGALASAATAAAASADVVTTTRPDPDLASAGQAARVVYAAANRPHR